MKTDAPDIRSLTSDEFETMAMSVDPLTAQIFFRDKMYTEDGKLRVIAQEYMANARDAHREVGKSDTPIEISLPTVLDPQFVVRDFGKGISPERLKDVFRIYGKTTKGGSNLENGGFGIGAKCGFSYANTFSVVTINARTKYVYSMYIDDAGMNQIATMYTGPAADTEPDGTEIKIPIRSSDHYKFTKWVHEVTHYWLPRPVFKGRAAEYRDDDTSVGVDGDPGRWTLRQSRGLSYISDKAGIWVLADDIPYCVPHDNAKECGETVAKLDQALTDLGLAVVIPFKVGEIVLYPNREILHYRAQTTHAIAARVSEAVTAIVAKLQAQLTAATTIAEAVTLWYQASPVVSLAAKLEHPVFRGHSILKAYTAEETGIVVSGGNVEPCGDNLGVKSFETRPEVSFRTLFQPADRSTRRYIVDPSSGELALKDLKRVLRGDGKGRVVVVEVTDAALAAQFVDYAGFVAAGYKPIVKPPPKSRARTRAEAVFVDVHTLYGSSSSTNPDGYSASTERQRTSFGDLDKYRFLDTRSVDVPGTEPKQAVEGHCGALGWRPIVEARRRYFLLTTLRSGLHRSANRLSMVTIATWAQRFRKHVDADDVVLFTDYCDDVVHEIEKLDDKGIRRMIYGGYHFGDFVGAQRWFWKNGSGGGDRKAASTRGKLVQILKDSGKFSDDFLALVPGYLRCEDREDDVESNAFIALHRFTPELDEMLGPTVVSRINAAIARFHAVRDEFEIMFKAIPELPYLLEAIVHTSVGENQRGVADDITLDRFVSALIADKYVASLQFSHLNNSAPPAELAQEGNSAP